MFKVGVLPLALVGAQSSCNPESVARLVLLEDGLVVTWKYDSRTSNLIIDSTTLVTCKKLVPRILNGGGIARKTIRAYKYHLQVPAF